MGFEPAAAAPAVAPAAALPPKRGAPAAAATAAVAALTAIAAALCVHEHGRPEDGGPGLQERPGCRRCDIRPHRRLGRLGHHRHDGALL